MDGSADGAHRDLQRGPPSGVHLAVLGGAELTHDGAPVSLPLGARRLLALLALHDGGVHRSVAASRLWPDRSPGRAGAYVRSALWRGRRIGTVTVIDVAGPRLVLAPDVRVDMHELVVAAQRVADRPERSPDQALTATVDGLGGDLLPGWPDVWLVPERQRWDQVRLHALERVAAALRAAGRYPIALHAASTAVAIDPIRESAHRVAIEIHLAEGNVASAIRQYERYRSVLRSELGVEPSPRIAHLIDTL